MLKGFSSLTKREIEVRRLIKIGMTDKEISESLGVSIRTTNNHVRSILSKYEIHDRKKLVFCE